MNQNDIYKNIASRSGGDIYIGVVGPVRTGKSTFIANFMHTLVVPAIENKHERERAVDDIPQSADGKTVMTTQPKFVPSKAVKVNFTNEVSANIRLVDCVGYLVSGANGAVLEDGKVRMVKTPWSDEDIPFEQAAEIGTQKVINDHSNVGILVTSDGTIRSDIERYNYVEAEERCVSELKALNKPFVVVLNSAYPESEECVALKNSLQVKYEVPVIALNATTLKKDQIVEIFEELLNEFPVTSVDAKLPEFLERLPMDNRFVSEAIEAVKEAGRNIKKVGDYKDVKLFETSENFMLSTVGEVKMNEGIIVFNVVPNKDLFYKVISEELGLDIKTEGDLVAVLSELAGAKREYDKVKNALESAQYTGYGIVTPDPSELKLDEPEITKQGGKFGVKLKATAPSLHIMKIDIETEVNPILGTEQQSEQMVEDLMSKFEANTTDLWETNIFGKSLNTLVREGIDSKLYAMPQNAQVKLRKTTQRIINEGKGGVICILL